MPRTRKIRRERGRGSDDYVGERAADIAFSNAVLERERLDLLCCRMGSDLAEAVVERERDREIRNSALRTPKVC